MIILGIESSCDETACGIVRDGNELLANAVLSSMDLHAAYGGVVPEIAARSHIESIVPVIEQALEEAFGKGSDNRAQGSEVNKQTQPSALSTLPYSDPWDQIDGIAMHLIVKAGDRRMHLHGVEDTLLDRAAHQIADTHAHGAGL